MTTPNVAVQEGAYLDVNNIEVIYDHVILVLKGVSLKVQKGKICLLYTSPSPRDS